MDFMVFFLFSSPITYQIVSKSLEAFHVTTKLLKAFPFLIPFQVVENEQLKRIFFEDHREFHRHSASDKYRSLRNSSAPYNKPNDSFRQFLFSCRLQEIGKLFPSHEHWMSSDIKQRKEKTFTISMEINFLLNFFSKLPWKLFFHLFISVKAEAEKKQGKWIKLRRRK